MPDWLDALTGPLPRRESELESLLERWSSSPGEPFDRAVLGGLVADRLGLAFAAGYRSALLALSGEDGDAAVCITEDGGAHPRAIRTRLRREGDSVVLDGAKQWATLAASARSVLVAASVGEKDGRNQLRMVRVPTDAEGLTWHAMPVTPFAPEIPHYRLTLERVTVPASAVLDGDGYSRWIKPFRTVEDIHVIAAATAHLVGTGRTADWPPGVLAEGLAVVAGLASLTARPPLQPSLHLALHGVMEAFEAWLGRCEGHEGSLDDEARRRWHRDRPLLSVAGRARAARFERACAELGLAPST